MTLGERIKALRESRKLTQRQVADKVGVTFTTIYYYEAGLKTPSLPVAIRLADVLNTSLDYMTGRTA